jgi:hypothetical protein
MFSASNANEESCVTRPFFASHDSGAFAALSGVFMSAAWLLFIDGLAIHARYVVEPIVGVTHWLPGLVAMFGFALLFFAPANAFIMSDAYSIFQRAGSCSIDCALFVVFITFVLMFGAVTGAIFLVDAMTSSASVYSHIPPSSLAPPSNVTDPALASADARGASIHAFTGGAIVGQAALIGLSAMACFRSRVLRAESAADL